MENGDHFRQIVRFGVFEADLQTGELRKSGIKVPLQGQPFQVCAILLSHSGELVTREELRQQVWPEDTFVDFDHALNTAITKIRIALGDEADNPRFVQTLPRRGYRFIAPVAKPSSQAVPPVAPKGWFERLTARRLVASTTLLILLSGIGIWRFSRDRAETIGGYLLRARPHLQPDKLTILPFTTFPGFEIGPSFSPDGNQIVFAWFGYEKEYRFDLYIKQVGQERVVQITHHPATFLASAWSPDGRLIAFMRYVEADPGASGIYLVSPLGGSERKLAAITMFGSWEPIAVTWSADGKWLAFPKASSPAKKGDSSPAHFSIHLVNVETTEERVLPDPSHDCVNTWEPAFSPDGKYLATVCVLTEGVAKIYVQSSDGREAREVTRAWSSQGFTGIAWAADSQSLLYGSDLYLWRVPLAGGKPEKLLFAQDVESVAVARTGNRLAYAQTRHPSSIWRLELASEVKPAGPATKLVTSSLGDGDSRISPDGRHIAFQSRRSGSPEVWVCDRDASNPVQLTFFGGPQIGSTSWSPDSRRIVFDLHASGNAELYIVTVDGGPPKRFSTGTTNASGPFWSVDGHWIYFNTVRPEAIWKAPVEGGAAVRLTGEGESRGWPQESVDGTRVFFYKVEAEHTRAWTASVNGGDERPVLGMPPDVSLVLARNCIYFFSGAPRHYSLNRFDLVTEQVHKIADVPGFFAIGDAHLSPDGHTFLFSGIEHSEGDIELVEGFR